MFIALFIPLLLVPSPVLRLRTIPLTTTSVQVKWDKPTKVDGGTSYLRYSVTVRQPGMNAIHFQYSRERKQQMNDIEPCIPYQVTVKAHSQIGANNGSTLLFFSKEGVPKKPVSNVSAVRQGPTSASVSWTPASPWEAKGVPKYKVLYRPIFSNGVGQCGAEESELTGEPHALLNDLHADMEYSIRVQVLTAEGIIEGPKSDTVRLHSTVVTEGLMSTAGHAAIAVSGGEVAGIFIGGMVFGAAILLAVCLVVLVVKKLKVKSGQSYSCR